MIQSCKALPKNKLLLVTTTSERAYVTPQQWDYMLAPSPTSTVLPAFILTVFVQSDTEAQAYATSFPGSS